MRFSYLLFLGLCILLSCNNQPTEEKNYAPKLMDEAYNVAFLIMDGVYNTELTAPFDIFQHTRFRDSIRPMNVFTVANTNEVITSFEGLRLLPDYNYIQDELPHVDILVVPSAEHHLDTDLEDTLMLNWVKTIRPPGIGIGYTQRTGLY